MRASRIVPPGYSDVITAVTASSPCWDARKNMIVPATPVTPVAAASDREPRGGSLSWRASSAQQASTGTDTASATRTGHRPLPLPARFKPMKNSAKPAPAARPYA
jgi:hypothetical protein